MEAAPHVPRTTFAIIGGGGFAKTGTVTALEEFILEQARSAQPSVCFVPTASGDDKDLILAFYEAFAPIARPSHVALLAGDISSAKQKLTDADVVFVGPGNTVNLLSLLRAHRLDEVLHQCATRGTVLAGVSAGAACWFESTLTDGFGDLQALKGLGFLPGSFCPHYDTEEDRRPAYRQLIADGTLPGGLALDDGVLAHFVAQELVSTVSARAIAYAYDVKLVDGEVRERKLRPHVLGT